MLVIGEHVERAERPAIGVREGVPHLATQMDTGSARIALLASLARGTWGTVAHFSMGQGRVRARPMPRPPPSLDGRRIPGNPLSAGRIRRWHRPADVRPNARCRRASLTCQHSDLLRSASTYAEACDPHRQATRRTFHYNPQASIPSTRSFSLGNGTQGQGGKLCCESGAGRLRSRP